MKIFDISILLLSILPWIFSPYFVHASTGSKVIQKETMVFDQCLKVIKMSSIKLSITPEILNTIPNNRKAIFRLSDGSLTITCDGERGLLIVTTDMS